MFSIKQLLLSFLCKMLRCYFHSQINLHVIDTQSESDNGMGVRWMMAYDMQVEIRMKIIKLFISKAESMGTQTIYLKATKQLCAAAVLYKTKHTKDYYYWEAAESHVLQFSISKTSGSVRFTITIIIWEFCNFITVCFCSTIYDIIINSAVKWRHNGLVMNNNTTYNGNGAIMSESI